MRLLAPGLLALLTACQPAADSGASGTGGPPKAAEPKAAQPGVAPVPVAALAGGWQVTSMNGVALAQASSLYLVGDADKLWWDPGCAGLARRYRIINGAIAFTPLRTPPAAGAPPAPVCAIGLPPRLGEVFQILDGAGQIRRTPEGGLSIEGVRGKLTLAPR